MINKIPLASVRDIKIALQDSRVVYWRCEASTCKRNPNGSYTVNVPVDTEHTMSVNLDKVIKMYGFRDFYTLKKGKQNAS